MIRFRPAFEDEWTDASLSGPEAEAATNILVTRLLSLEYEVEALAGDEWISYEEFEHDDA